MEIIIILAFWFFVFYKSKTYRVPFNTTIIIDRNGHYLATKKPGETYRLKKGDAVTTTISQTPYREVVTDTFEMHDGAKFTITVSCTYHANNIENVLTALSNVRRSIQDILKSAIYFAFESISSSDYRENPAILSSCIRSNLIRELDSIHVKLDKCSVLTPVLANTTYSYSPNADKCDGINSTSNHLHKLAISAKSANYKQTDSIIDDEKYDRNGPITFYH